MYARYDSQRFCRWTAFKQNSVCIHCDSQSATYLSKNQMYKHNDVMLHFVRDAIEKGEIDAVNVHTSYNPADMITKPVPLCKFKHCPRFSKINVDWWLNGLGGSDLFEHQWSQSLWIVSKHQCCYFHCPYILTKKSLTML